LQPVSRQIRGRPLQPIQLFDLASQQTRWLSVRQATLAQNVANASTPSYKALDTRPFQEVLNKTQLDMAVTAPSHIVPTGGEFGAIGTKGEDAWEVTHTGNSVSLEQELMKAGEVNRNYSLNSSIVKAFHGMLMSSVKSA
jgi:flagellar basal-body rod protein FlgB